MASKILYVGTDPSRFPRQVVHLPLIETRALPLSGETRQQFSAFTAIILTSPNAARILTDQISLKGKEVFAIGRGTEEVLKDLGVTCSGVALPETQEGMVELLKKRNLQKSYLFYPRSSSARPLLKNYLQESGLRYQVCDLYKTVFLKPNPLPDLDYFDEIVFTSPSTIKAFIEIYHALPKGVKVTCLGPITLEALKTYL